MATTNADPKIIEQFVEAFKDGKKPDDPYA